MIEYGVWGSLAISALAFWRSGRSKLLDRRTDLRKERAVLLVMLENLADTIPAAVNSRSRISAMTGQAGALQGFREEAEADAAAIAQMRGQLTSIEPIPWFAGYATLEKCLVLAHEVTERIKLLQEKYALAAEVDTAVRRERREEMLRQVERVRSGKG